MGELFSTLILTFVFLLVGVPLFLGILRFGLWFTTVEECHCKVFVQFLKALTATP